MTMIISNLPRQKRLGAPLVPFNPLLIPSFEIILNHQGKSKTASVGFDTGLQDAAIEMPSTLASTLGIKATGSEVRGDARQSFTVYTARIDSISLPGKSACVLRNAKVLFFPGAPLLIGNDFIAEIAARISYDDGPPKLTCDTSQDPDGRTLPIFPVKLTYGGKTTEFNAYFDTGWEGSDIALPWNRASSLGLPALGTVTAKAHSGIVTLTVSKAERLALKGLEACAVSSPKVHIIPRGAPLSEPIVGEGFLKKVGGTIAYDTQGAYFTCKAGPQGVRAVGRGFLPDFLIGDTLDKFPWLLGVASFVGVLGVSYVVYEWTARERRPSGRG